MDQPGEKPDLDALRLALVPGVGPLLGKALLDHFGSAKAVLDAPRGQLLMVDGVGSKLASLLISARQQIDAKEEFALCEAKGVAIVPRGDPAYPATLERIPDPPGLIYVKGSFTPRDELAIAVVGSRRSSPYGLRVAERLGAALARTGFTIVSGLARGIDAAAHRGALAAGGRTIAVLANGLDTVYPPEHAGLAEEVAGSGALVSESPMRRKPLAAFFTQRNRIISGLALGVLVVEATPRSGSLSTARHALEQNREVFAVPGPVDSLSSRGCHRLIKDGARLVETVEDILEGLGPLVAEITAAPDQPPIRRPAELALSDIERDVLFRLSDTPTGIDEIIVLTGLTAGQALATLSILELKQLIERRPGGRYVRS